MNRFAREIRRTNRVVFRHLAGTRLLLLMSLLLLGLSGCSGGSSLNYAAAFGWRGHVDTNVQFSEFFASDHTVMLRFMPQYPAAYTGPLLASDHDGGGSFFVGMGELVVGEGEIGSDNIRLHLHVNGQDRFYTLGGLLARGFWYHVAVVRSGNTYRLYVNGSRLDTDGCSAPPCDLVVLGSGPAGNVRLGRLADGSFLSGHEAQFYGLIDDVAIFDRALSAGEIDQIRARDRITGDESGLLAGFTFDSFTPNGDPLPGTLARPAVFRSPADQGVTYEGVGARVPAQKVPVSQTRDHGFDAEYLPPPFQQVELRLPFPAGEAWKVSQGWENTRVSHMGRAAFAWDFILAQDPAATRGRPIFASASGTVTETVDGETCGSGWPANYVAMDHAPDEVGVYLHFLAGSLQVAQGDVVTLGDYLGDTGDTGNTDCGNDHLHFALHDLPESQPNTLVTFPSAFSFYEASDDNGATWYPVDRGVPRFGQWVRNPATGSSPP
jgi:murein DD-endopeptidase MepM/ murein hydrolase activator NlpD